MLEVGKYYLNDVGNLCKCLKIEGDEVSMRMLLIIPKDVQIMAFTEDEKKKKVDSFIVDVSFDIKYSDRYRPFTDEENIKKISHLFSR
jgi:hypothetical protein